MTSAVRVIDIHDRPPVWALTVLDELESALAGRPDPYVCPFAPRLLATGDLWATAFELESGRAAALVDIVTTVIHNGSAIAIALGPPPLGRGLSDHRTMFWRLIALLIRNDPTPWPRNSLSDPAEPSWSLHLGGDAVFALATSPYYERRRSRRLTSTLVALIQPLSMFNAMLPDRSQAAKAKSSIRRATQRLDAMEPHQFLGSTDASSTHKIRQYFLPDDDSNVLDAAAVEVVREAMASRSGTSVP